MLYVCENGDVFVSCDYICVTFEVMLWADGSPGLAGALKKIA